MSQAAILPTLSSALPSLLTLSGTPRRDEGLVRVLRLLRAAVTLAGEARRRAPMSPAALRDLGLRQPRRITF